MGRGRHVETSVIERLKRKDDGYLAHTAITLCLSLIIFICGVCAEAHHGPKLQILSRSGALIILAGLISVAILARREKAFPDIDEIIDEYMKQANPGISFGVSIKPAFNHAQDRIRNKHVYTIEISIFLFGTFLWGFGDLLANIAIHCSAPTCD